MSESYPEPAPDAPLFGRTHPNATRTVWFWALPVVVALALSGLLATFYLSSVLRPMTNLRHFPIAILNEDAGPTGAQMVKGLLSNFDTDAYQVRVLNHDQAKEQMDTAQVYGIAVIPPNFSSTLQAYAKTALTPGRVERPAVIISTNQRAGALGASIAGQTLQRTVATVNHLVGERLTQEVARQTGRKPESGAATLLLANPIEAKTTIHNALPDGTGSGTSAFVYTMLLLIAGFVGSLVIAMSVTSMLAPDGPVSRVRTLLISWGITVVVALPTSVGFILIATGLGMPVGNGWPLWLFGVLVISAVGITTTSLIAALGRIGALAALFVFLILGLQSSGETVPVEATPAFFGWVSTFEPMHQVYLGARALLYLDGRAAAGLSHSIITTTIGLGVGLVIGLVATRLQDRRSARDAAPPAVSEPVAPTAAPEAATVTAESYPEL